MFKRLIRLLRIDSAPPGDENDMAVSAAIENAVDRIDPRIRLIGGYHKKLRPAVTHALLYASAIVERVPGPIEVSEGMFGLDPRVHAFFISVDQMQRVLSLSRDARKFFAAPEHKERTECYGLLVMDKRERNVLGAELRGEIIQKDVPQVTVSFTEHRVLASSPTPVDLKRSVASRVFKDLIACTVEKILHAQVQRQALESQHNRLKLQLRMLESRTQGLEDALKEMEIRDEEEITTVRRMLADTEQKLRDRELQWAATNFSTLDNYLEQINEVLSRPEDYFRLREESVRLNRIGIMTSAESSQVSDEIPFVTVKLGRSLRCVAVLIKYARTDMLPVDYYLKKALLT
jgi:hypothetical protein